jgi:hypothetical protein
VKWLDTAQHHVQNHACAPDIHLLVVLGLRKDLGGTERDRASLRDQFLALASFSGNIEVQQIHDVFRRNQEVLRFDVPMDYLVLMKVFNSPQNLLEYCLGLELSVELERLPGDLVEDLLPLDILHYEVHFAGDLIFK